MSWTCDHAASEFSVESSRIPACLRSKVGMGMVAACSRLRVPSDTQLITINPQSFVPHPGDRADLWTNQDKDCTMAFKGSDAATIGDWKGKHILLLLTNAVNIGSNIHKLLVKFELPEFLVKIVSLDNL